METSSRLNESLLYGTLEDAQTGNGHINISPLDPGMLLTPPGTSTDIHGNYVHTASPVLGSVSGVPPLSSYTPATTLVDPAALFPDALNGTILRPQQPTGVVSSEPQSIMVRLASRHVPGIILPGAIYYRRPGYHFPQRRYAVLLDEPIAETDCGAEVIDPSTGNISGYIEQVEHYSRVQVAYAVAVADSAWDMNRRFNEETRQATLWYDRRRRIFPTSLIPPNPGMTSEISSASYTQQPSVILPSQAGLGYGDSHASPFQLSTPPISISGPTTRPQSACSPFSVPAILGSNNSNNRSNRNNRNNNNSGGIGSRSSSKAHIRAPCRNPNIPKKDYQVQFVHYHGTSSDNVKKEKSASRSIGDGNTDDGNDTWKDSDKQDSVHGLVTGGSSYGDCTDDETPISKLLPDRKCPFYRCPYHKKGFMRKHDLVRHIITHYDGRLYCGFCPEGLSQTFGRPYLRVEPLKRHLAVIHNAAKYRKSQNTTETYLRQRLSEYGTFPSGHCSICARQFSAPTKLYNHIEGCVVRLLLERAKTDGDLPLIPDDGGGEGLDT